jgi:transcription termination/antitermination protein NusG
VTEFDQADEALDAEPTPEAAAPEAAEAATAVATEERADGAVEPTAAEPAAEAAAAEPVVELAAAGPAVEAATAVATEERPEDVREPDEEAGDLEPVVPPASPYDLPGSWFVIHSYSGYENKVKANLGTRIKSMHMEDSIFDVVIPMEDVVEIKSGKKVTVPRKQFPGYLLVRMYLDDDSWGVVRNTPGVTGFVGSGTKPTPLSRREVERILGVRKDEEKKVPKYKPDWEIGETIRVIDGPFADFNGIIEDINVDQSKVRVLVDIFGRETPVELNFEQIQKF